MQHHQLFKYIVLEDVITLLEANLLTLMLFKTCMIFHKTKKCVFFLLFFLQNVQTVPFYKEKQLQNKQKKKHKSTISLPIWFINYITNILDQWAIAFLWGLRWNSITFNPLPCFASSKYDHISKVCRDFDFILPSNVRNHKGNVLLVQNKPRLPSSINSSFIHKS